MRNKKVRIEKVINNNIISARDDKGVELVVMGRGIGFDKKPGNETCALPISHCLLNI